MRNIKGETKKDKPKGGARQGLVCSPCPIPLGSGGRDLGAWQGAGAGPPQQAQCPAGEQLGWGGEGWSLHAHGQQHTPSLRQWGLRGPSPDSLHCKVETGRFLHWQKFHIHLHCKSFISEY